MKCVIFDWQLFYFYHHTTIDYTIEKLVSVEFSFAFIFNEFWPHSLFELFGRVFFVLVFKSQSIHAEMICKVFCFLVFFLFQLSVCLHPFMSVIFRAELNVYNRFQGCGLFGQKSLIMWDEWSIPMFIVYCTILHCLQ